MIADTVFVFALLLAAYPYIGYPVLLYLLVQRRQEPKPPAGTALPSVCMITSAYNEADVIGAKVANLRDTQYPRELFSALIGSDGSEDGTVALARNAADANVEVVDFPCRRGKAAVLGDLVALADSDVIVLSDANTLYEPNAVRQLARWFGDPSVGCVCGRLRLVAQDGRGQGERFYWAVETWLKRLENRVGAVLGANGGIYAFRRSAYEPLASDTITDDFVLPLLIRKKGYRIIYDASAVAREETAPTTRHEFTRRARIGAGNLQALWYTRELLSPGAGWTAFAYWSHKIARWIAPGSLAVAVVVALIELPRIPYVAAAGVIGLLCLVTLIGWMLERMGRRPPKIVSLVYSFTAMNAALLVGALRFLAGRRDARWSRTPRQAEDLRTRTPSGEGSP